MRWGIIALTRGGLELAKELRLKLPGAVIHAPSKLNYLEGEIINERFETYVGSIFNKFEILIFIMAAGIVVRSISKYIKDKTTDPGILVIDEKGKYVISLLSGHIGGANEAAERVAQMIGAAPVITTSSDVNDLMAVDMLAKDLNCAIDDMNSAKAITSLIVNKEKVALLSDIEFAVPEFFTDDPADASGVIYITNKKLGKSERPYVQLIPANIIAGIGCRKGVSKEAIINLIEDKLNELGKDKRSLKCLCSAAIKKEEPALVEAAHHFKTDLRFISLEEIKSIEEKYAASGFVKEKIGVGAVCEPCAYLASNGSGRMIMTKQKAHGVTLALWEEEM